jgi:hypothetical protein
MTNSYSPLAQVKSIAGTVVPVLTVSASTSVATSHLSIVNTGSGSASYSLYVIDSLEVETYAVDPANKHALIKQKYLTSGTHHEFTGGITLSQGDGLFLEATTSDVVVNVYGVEIA